MTREHDGRAGRGSDRLELPNGDLVADGDVILFEGYPYRVDLDEGIVLAPVYWGDSNLDLAFEDAAEIAREWGEESRGRMSQEEWTAWLESARADDRFGDAELDAIADAVLAPGDDRRQTGLLGRLRELFGFE